MIDLLQKSLLPILTPPGARAHKVISIACRSSSSFALSSGNLLRQLLPMLFRRALYEEYLILLTSPPAFCTRTKS